MLVSRSGHEINFTVDEAKVSEILQFKKSLGDNFPKFGILVLSYNAKKTIKSTIDRIPKELKDIISEIFIFDDNSPDGTFEIADSFKEESFWKDKLSVFKNNKNLQYGGNQKTGYTYGIERGMDFIIMLHGDGQYAPEYIPDLILPAIKENKKVVFASRMMNKKDALKGGMPFYKFLGNQVLTRFENLILGTKLYEFHSGYRMYSAEVLNRIPFQENTNDFHFDTQIIIQCRALGIDIHEVPIKTFYGDEECNVDGMKYARDVIFAVLHYRLHQAHLIRSGNYFVKRELVYKRKRSANSSHEKILSHLKNIESTEFENKKVLEFGGGNGNLYADMKSRGYEVTCVDYERTEFSKIPSERFIQSDNISLDHITLGREFDYVVLSDNLAQTYDDEMFLKSIKRFIKLDGELLVVVPNIAIWFYRLSLLLGRFNYGDRGVLDRKNRHFYTRSSINNLLERSGYNIHELQFTSVPFELVFETVGKSKVIRFLDSVYALVTRFFPTIFAYQFILKASVKDLEYAKGEGRLV